MQLRVDSGHRVVERRSFLGVIAGGLVAAPLAAGAQQAGKVWRIGFLTSGFREGTGSDVRLAPFFRGLRELGYIEGRNVILEIRYAEGRAERFPVLAAELVSLKVDVLVARSSRAPSPVILLSSKPTKFELVINLKAAKALGLTIPPSLLLRADQVIE
jgi:putative ABC transport system substrate-binding protein